MTTRQFTHQELEDLGLPDDPEDGVTILDDEPGYESRWMQHHTLVFTHPDGTGPWGINYQTGRTELQECEPFEYESDPLIAHLMRSAEKTVIEWVRA
jgi:hypothetical protein